MVESGKKPPWSVKRVLNVGKAVVSLGSNPEFCTNSLILSPKALVRRYLVIRCFFTATNHRVGKPKQITDFMVCYTLIVDHMKNARAVIIEEGTHFVYAENPMEVNLAIGNFLKSL